MDKLINKVIGKGDNDSQYLSLGIGNKQHAEMLFSEKNTRMS